MVLYSPVLSLQLQFKQTMLQAATEVSQALSNYLELIKAQEKLLSAQLGEAESSYKAREAVISLYKALGMK